MNLFILNLLLAFGFSAIIAQFNLQGLLVGFVLGYAALWLTQPLYPSKGYFGRMARWARLIGQFIVDLFASSVEVMWEVITPGQNSRPGIVAVPLDVTTDLGIMLVANLISLTPGTLSLDVSEDRRFLFVHVMFLDDRDAAVRDIKNGLEKRILEALR
jgi:multicomponent Na+:H+ antiporter subunit E